ncbi:hypothetical protein HW555_009857 [Spodoptera exigua]|uniref:BED-type domain-containing protein n=1 Tax=Spodoptera exigua TaxID=7107 RepID=A0A835G8D0_SPOEX|nr:hypothetical protein HW555_009857 [Spodoptera exigua]
MYIMPRKKNADVWENYFHSATSKTVKCKHCEKVYQFGNVSKMRSHLLKCYRCPSVIKDKQQKIPVTSTTATNRPLQDESHSEILQDNSLTDTSSIKTTSSEISAEKKLYLDQLLLKAIFVTGSPLSIVEHPLWQGIELEEEQDVDVMEFIHDGRKNSVYISFKDDDNDEDDEPLSTPRQLSSPLGSPINEEKPS